MLLYILIADHNRTQHLFEGLALGGIIGGLVGRFKVGKRQILALQCQGGLLLQLLGIDFPIKYL